MKYTSCTLRNPAGPESGPELDLPFVHMVMEFYGSLFRTIRILKDLFAGFVSILLCECNLSPMGVLERTGAYQDKIALIAV